MNDMERYTIIEAQESDAQAISEHMKRASTETDFMLRYPDEMVSEEETQIQTILANIRNPDTFYLIVKYDDTIVGFAMLTSLSPCRRMAHRRGFGISLEKAHWNRGIGTRLMQACFAYARKNGVELIDLEVHTLNERASAFYRKQGFVERSRDSFALKNRDGSYYELISMRWDARMDASPDSRIDS